MPTPARVVEFYDRFEEGVFSIEAGRVPALAILTALIWATEAMRAVPMIGSVPIKIQTGVDGLSLAFALSLGLLCGLIFGAAPAAQGAPNSGR